MLLEVDSDGIAAVSNERNLQYGYIGPKYSIKGRNVTAVKSASIYACPGGLPACREFLCRDEKVGGCSVHQ